MSETNLTDPILLAEPRCAKGCQSVTAYGCISTDPTTSLRTPCHCECHHQRGRLKQVFKIPTTKKFVAPKDD